MKISIESTENITDVEGVTVRVWEGITEAGTRCKVFVHRIAVDNNEEQGQFDRELQEQMSPGRFIPLRNIL